MGICFKHTPRGRGDRIQNFKFRITMRFLHLRSVIECNLNAIVKILHNAYTLKVCGCCINMLLLKVIKNITIGVNRD